MFSLAKGGELKSAATNSTDSIRPHSAQTSSRSDFGSNKWKVVNGWGPEYPSIIFPFWLTRYAYLDAWMIDLDSGKMQEEPCKLVMAKTMMITQLQSPWQLLKLQICAQHQPDMVQWISLKSIFLVLCTQTLTWQQQSGCTSVFNHMQKGFKDIRQNPTHYPSHCALIPIPRVVFVEGFLVNALQCKKVNAIYVFTNSDLRNVIYS